MDKELKEKYKPYQKLKVPLGAFCEIQNLKCNLRHAKIDLYRLLQETLVENSFSNDLFKELVQDKLYALNTEKE